MNMITPKDTRRYTWSTGPVEGNEHAIAIYLYDRQADRYVTLRTSASPEPVIAHNPERLPAVIVASDPTLLADAGDACYALGTAMLDAANRALRRMLDDDAAEDQ